MNNASAILRSLIIYVIVVPLAMFVGYLLTGPLDYSTLAIYALLALALVFPLLMRWHYPLLLFSWSSTITLFFLKGAPNLWIAAVVLSLGLSMLDRILLPDRRFIRVPQISWPLICMIGIILFTAKMTGGLGFHAFGSEVMGGRKYVLLIIGILSYFAITAKPIPPEKAKLYIALFFLGGMTTLVGDLYPLAPNWASVLFYIFPPGGNYDPSVGFQVGVTRLGGIGGAAIAVCLWMLARYGVRGIFLEGKLWRPVLWIICFLLDFLGGFRSGIFQVAACFLVMFFMEGMHRTRLLLVAVFAALLIPAMIVPLAPHLPFTFQRALAFLPLNISPEARWSADASTNWRMDMWKALLPQVPKHLLLGKGYVITAEDFENMGQDSAFKAIDPSQQGLALAGDYHNGILSVVLPFGIWGLIGYLWFMIAGLWVLYSNWKNGNPELQTVNAVLFAMCLLDFFCFASCLAGFSINVGYGFWAGHVGFSVALNGGVRRAEPRPVPAIEPRALPRPFPRPRPAFQRHRIGI